MQNLLAAGEQIEAEVVSIREAAEAFRPVLRLTMGSGRRATVEVSSNKPAAPGTRWSSPHCPIPVCWPRRKRPDASQPR